VQWTELAQDRFQWFAFVKTVGLEHTGSINGWEFLDKLEHLSLKMFCGPWFSLVLQTRVGASGLDSSGSGWEPLVGSCKQVTNHRVPQKAGNFWTSCATTVFLRTTCS
jgi:hypothetical protein